MVSRLYSALVPALIFVLFEDCLDRGRHSPANFGIALFAAALYGVHPALAETVNCVIQRADLYAVIGLVAGLVLYARRPLARRNVLYLLPVQEALRSRYTAATCHVGLRESDAAITAAQRALRISPDSSPAREILDSTHDVELSSLLWPVGRFWTVGRNLSLGLSKGNVLLCKLQIRGQA